MSTRCLTLALILAGGLLVGCGGGKSQNRNARPVAKSTPQRPITTARVAAFAHSVNLTVADVPGSSATPRGPQNETGAERRELQRCGLVPKKLLSVKSQNLTRGVGLARETFSSSVNAFASTRLAELDVAPLAEAKHRACVTPILRQRLQRVNIMGGHPTAVAVTWLAVSAPGASAAAGIRLKATIVVGAGTTVSVFEDLYAFVLGPVEISLITSSLDQPVASTTERQLLSLLQERAHTHSF